jgi:Tfp pilus assembly PilM family ATPase
MAAFTRTNPTAVARGTIQYTSELTFYKVVLNGSGLAVAASDANAAKISDALGSIARLFQFKSNGLEIFMVADRHSTDIDSVARLIAQVLNTGAAFTNTAGSGVATLSDSNTITVTVPTDLEGM